MKEIPKPSIEALYDHFDLRLDPRDRGGWRQAQCPLPDHEDENPSASINEDEGKWHCHVCDETGDGVDMIMRRNSVGFVRACAIAQDFVDGHGGAVREERRSSSLLPSGQRNHRGRGNWTPPWTSV